MSTIEAAVAAIPSLEDVCEVANSVWVAFVDPEGILVPWHEGPADAGFVATVTVFGSWHGDVSLMLPEDVARQAVCNMLETDEVADDEFLDGVGELANMIGGNIKSILPIECTMNTPTVVASDDLAAEAVDEHSYPIDLAWQGRPIRILIKPLAG